MHIALHQTVIEFLIKQHSEDLYVQSLGDAGIDRKDFEAENYHSDAELDQLIEAAGKRLGQDRDEFLTNVGLVGAPGLFEAFKGFVEPDWKVLDLIENIETRMHKHVREEMGAFPPALVSERVSNDELKVTVRSHRKMAGLARGFIQGFATLYDENVSIDIDANDSGYSFQIKRTA